MKTYTLYLRDRRLGQTVTLTGQFAHDRRAREYARQRLDASPHHEWIEVWDGTARLCRFGVADEIPRAA